MPPLFLVEDDEQLTIRLGTLPAGFVPTADQPEPDPADDDRTILTFRRLRYSERQAFFQLFHSRGRTDMDAFNMAVIATCILGWERLMGRRGEIPFPTLEDVSAETRPEDMGPEYPYWLPGTPLFAQRKRVLQVVEQLLMESANQLVQRMQDPSPEELIKNWQRQSSATNASPAPTPATAIPASIADPNVLTPVNGSLATVEA